MTVEGASGSLATLQLAGAAGAYANDAVAFTPDGAGGELLKLEPDPGPTLSLVSSPGVLEAGQSEVIGTVEPGVAGQTFDAPKRRRRRAVADADRGRGLPTRLYRAFQRRGEQPR